MARGGQAGGGGTRSRADWGLNLERLGMPDVEVCEPWKVGAQGNDAGNAAFTTRIRQRGAAETEGPAWRASQFVGGGEEASSPRERKVTVTRTGRCGETAHRTQWLAEDSFPW